MADRICEVPDRKKKCISLMTGLNNVITDISLEIRGKNKQQVAWDFKMEIWRSGKQRRLLSDWSIHTLVPRFIAPRATETLINKHGCRREDFYLSLLDHLLYSFV